MAKKSKKTKKPAIELIDKDGKWIEEKRFYIGAIRRLMRQSPMYSIVSSASRKEVDKFNKDGSKSKKPSVLRQCEVCLEWFSTTMIAIDHIMPAVPVYLSNEELSFDEIRQGIICKIDNLQRICNPKKGKKPGFLETCHQKKTNFELFMRKKWANEFLNEEIINKNDKDFHYKKQRDLLETSWAEEYTVELSEKIKKMAEKEERKRLKLLKKNKK